MVSGGGGGNNGGLEGTQDAGLLDVTRCTSFGHK